MRAALALLAACGHQAVAPTTQFVVVNERFSAATMEALEALDAAAPGLYRWDGEPAPGETVVHIEATRDGWPETGGTARTDANVIYLDAGMRPSWEHLPITIVHELGHARGLCHSSDPKNVMYKSTTKTDHTLESAARDVVNAVIDGGNCD